MLVVDGSDAVGGATRDALRSRFGGSLSVAVSLAQATLALDHFQPDVVLLDLGLPDGSALAFLRALREAPRVPQVVAFGDAPSADVAFELGRLGVRALLTKPVSEAVLLAAVDRVLLCPPDLTALLRASVGYLPMRELEAQVRQTLIREALGRSGGSRSQAARLLCISRQLLQHILR